MTGIRHQLSGRPASGKGGVEGKRKHGERLKAIAQAQIDLNGGDCRTDSLIGAPDSRFDLVTASPTRMREGKFLLKNKKV